MEVFCIHLGHNNLQCNHVTISLPFVNVMGHQFCCQRLHHCHVCHYNCCPFLILIGLTAGGDILEGMPPGQVKAARHMLQDLRVSIVTNAMVSFIQTCTDHACCHARAIAGLNLHSAYVCCNICIVETD